MGSTYSFVNKTKNLVNEEIIDDDSPQYRSFNTLNDGERKTIFELILTKNNWPATDLLVAKTNNDEDGIVQCYTYVNGTLTSIIDEC